MPTTAFDRRGRSRSAHGRDRPPARPRCALPHRPLRGRGAAVPRIRGGVLRTWGSRDHETLWEGADARRGNVSELWSWLGKREIARPEAADLFADVRLSKVPVETVETVEAMLGVVRTTSAYLRLDGERQGVFARRLAGLVEAEGGTHRSTHFATLVTARAAA